MKRKLLCDKLLILITLWVCGSICTAQEANDSLYNQAKVNVYKNPGNAYQAGLSLYESQEATPEQRMDGLILAITALNSLRDYESAGSYVQKALELLNDIQSVNTKIAVLNQLGYINQQLRLYDEALKHLDAALALCKQQPMSELVYAQIGFNHAARGFIYKEQMNCTIALNSFAEAMDFLKKGPERDATKANLSIVAYNRGNCLLLLLDHKAALEAFETSIIYAESIDGQSLLAFAKKGIAEVYTAQGNYNKAVDFLQEAVIHADGIGDLVLNMGIEKGFANNYLALSEWTNYSEHQKNYESLQTQLLAVERKSIANVLSLNHAEYLSNIEKEKYKSNIYYMVLLLIIVGILVTYLVYARILQDHSRALKSRLKGLEKVNVSA